MMTFGYSFNIWVPLLLFPTAGPDGAPRWRKGWPTTFVFYFFLWAGFITAIVLYRRDTRRKEIDVGSETGSESDGGGVRTPEVEAEVVVEATKR
jgi:hypothetical protein